LETPPTSPATKSKATRYLVSIIRIKNNGIYRLCILEFKDKSAPNHLKCTTFGRACHG